MTNGLRSILVATVSGSAMALLSGCGRGDAEQAQQAPPPTVTVAPVSQRSIIEWDEFTGRTEPVETVELRPRVSGYIQAVRFQSGQMVEKGDVLFEIDPDMYQAEFDGEEARYLQAKVRMENAKLEAERTGRLLAGKAISVEEGDARLARFKEAEAALRIAEAARDAAKLNLEYTRVTAPIDGRVSRAMNTAGNYVNGQAGGATLLTTIVSVDPVYVYADMDENSLLKFNALARETKLASNADGKIPVELQLADDDEFAHRGHIESFDNRVDPGTGSILLRAVFSNDDGAILPGLFARIRVPLSGRHAATLIDDRAVGTDQGNKYVLTLTETNTVAYRPVKLGPVIDGMRVIRSGLQPGEKIVVNGLQRVRPGMPVTPQLEVAAAKGDTADF